MPKQQPSALSNRDYQIDNAKSLLIFLVVLGHIVEAWQNANPVYLDVYKIIYSFHLPMFSLISGYLAKNFVKAREKAFSEVLIPYLFWELAFSIGMRRFPLNLFAASFTSWYLLSLFFWRLFIKDAVKIRFALPVFLVLSLYVGSLPQVNEFLSLSRTFIFFPFFLMGYYISFEAKNKLQKYPFAVAFIAFAALCAFAVFYYEKPYPVHAGYAATGYTLFEGLKERVIYYLLGTAMSFFFIRLIPKKKNILTGYGENTIVVFLFHSVLIVGLKSMPDVFSPMPPYIGLPIFLVISAVIFWIFSNRWSLRAYEWGIGLVKRAVYMYDKAEK